MSIYVPQTNPDIYGTLQTSTQPNIKIVGSLTQLDVVGNCQIGGDLGVTGSLSKGAGSFLINHPNPIKAEQGYKLQHCFVESNTAGDNIYRFDCEAKKDGEVVEIVLPDYYKYLNNNTDLWINGINHFGKGYGSINDDETKLLITCEKVGLYKVLCIGTRKDEIALKNFSNGVEYITL